MRLFRFDPAVSVPITAHGSELSMAPLTAPGPGVRTSVLRIGPGGRVGRHPSVGPQLWAVVAGSATVRGEDGADHVLVPGQAVLWADGEDHDATSDEGMTALHVESPEGTFDVWASAVTQEIEVVDYDPGWPRAFQRLHDRLWPVVAEVAVRIDHVGSTAVPGLAAKPIVDLDIVVADDDDVARVTERLVEAGYRWRGDLGVTGRHAYDLRLPDTSLPRHHLYTVVEDNRAHLDHWLLRDLLRSDPEARERYGRLKRRNAEAAGGDMDAYVAAKADLVAELLTRARGERGLPPVTYWRPLAPGGDAAGGDAAGGTV